MKRVYETVLVVDALLPDEKIEAVIKTTEDFLSKNSELKKVDRRGKRRLSYEIKKKTHGDYTVFTYGAEGSLIMELERKLRLNEAVLRFLTVVQEGEN